MYWRLAASISISTSTVLPQLLILLALLLLWQPCAKFSKTLSLVRRRRQPAATKMYEIQNTKPKRLKPKTDKKYKTKRQKKKKGKEKQTLLQLCAAAAAAATIEAGDKCQSKLRPRPLPQAAPRLADA